MIVEILDNYCENARRLHTAEDAQTYLENDIICRINDDRMAHNGKRLRPSSFAHNALIEIQLRDGTFHRYTHKNRNNKFGQQTYWY